MATPSLSSDSRRPVHVDDTLINTNFVTARVYNHLLAEKEAFICDGTTHFIDLQVNREIDLNGVSFFGPTEGSCIYYVTIRIIKNVKEISTILYDSTGLVYSDRNEIFTVPVGSIRLSPTNKSFPEESYRIVFCLWGKKTLRLSLKENETGSTLVENCIVSYRRSIGQISDLVLSTASSKKEPNTEPIATKRGELIKGKSEYIRIQRLDPVISTQNTGQPDTTALGDSGVFSPESSGCKQDVPFAERVEDICTIRPSRNPTDIIHSQEQEQASTATLPAEEAHPAKQEC